MFIIESQEDYFNFLPKFRNSKVLIIPVYSDVNKHPKRNSLCLIYFYLIDYSESYIISFNHSEGVNLSTDIIDKLESDNNIYVYEKKKFSFFKFSKEYFDADLVNYFQTNKPLDVSECETPAQDFLMKYCYNEKNVNQLIPLVKHFEYCENIKNIFVNALDGFKITEPFKHYNGLIDNLYNIERNGMFVDYQLFTESFGTNGIEQNIAFTEYNVYTSTGRPSNRFGGVNYNALNKEDGTRAAFISRHGDRGYIVQFDYDAFHLRLIGELIGYTFPTSENIHNYLGNQYFGHPVSSEEEYNESKGISFKQLYGGISSEFMDIPYFKKVAVYIDTLWDSYLKKGYVETPIFKRKLYRRFFNDMNKNKLFNYVLQAYETEFNSIKLADITSLHTRYKSSLILYTYDSFCFDFDQVDGAEFIKEIKKVLESNGAFPVKIHAGINYSELKEITQKV